MGAKYVPFDGDKVHEIAGGIIYDLLNDPGRLARMTAEIVSLLARKNADYGNSWCRQGIGGVLSRLSDKFFRVETLADGREALIVDEKIDDTLQDAVAYALLGLLYLRSDGAAGTDGIVLDPTLLAYLAQPVDDEYTRFRHGEPLPFTPDRDYYLTPGQPEDE
jgi:hypothetical protein